MAIDPGLDTGWCMFLNGGFADKGIIRGLDPLIDWFETHFAGRSVPDLIVMEKYRLFKHLALQQSGSKMEVAQAEGITKAWAYRKKVIIAEQFSDILPIAVKWTGIPLPKNHRESHDVAAFNHGMYYMISRGMVNAPNET